MPDRPIIFSAAMIRQLIAGKKTQTRRVVVPPAPFAVGDDIEIQIATGEIKPQYAVGDQLWVREAWRTFVSLDDVSPASVLSPERGAGICYEAGGGASVSRPPGRTFFSDYSLDERHDRNAFGRLRPSIHMPRDFSRLTLMVTNVRVQRLQQISEEDARAEGIFQESDGSWNSTKDYAPLAGYNAYGAYYCLWESLHGKGSWKQNPFVAAISFSVEQRNIDSLKEAA